MAERGPVTTAGRTSSVLALLGVLIVWSVLAWAFIFAFSGGHVCTILQPVGDYGASLTETELADLMAAKTAACDRPDLGAIAVFGAGYIVIAAVVIGRSVSVWRARSGDRAQAPPSR